MASGMLLNCRKRLELIKMAIMKQPGFQAAEPQPLESNRTRQARSYHRPGRLLLVAFLLLLAFIGFAALIIGIVQMLFSEASTWGWLALAGVGLFTVTRVAVFLLSASLTCPLCHGTVMHERRCRKHEKAFRLWPLSYRASAVLSLFTTASFRCMYCGTAYRLRRSMRER